MILKRKRVYTVNEVMEILKISRTKLYALRKNEILKPIKNFGKCIRFSEKQISNLLEGKKR